MRRDLFIGAQALVYDDAIRELEAGKKETHWSWVVFPQLVGLGRSRRSRLFGLAETDVPEYASDPVLGPRLVLALLKAHQLDDVHATLGELDAAKLRSCATLFARLAPEGARIGSLAEDVLVRHFFGLREGVECPVTLALLS